MGFRFQKRISLFPGFRLNLSKSGVSASVGPRGADVNIGPHGSYMNAGLPDTGLSYRQKIGGVTHGDALSPPRQESEDHVVSNDVKTGHGGGGWIAALLAAFVFGGGGYWLGSHNVPQNIPLASSVSTPLNDAASPAQAPASAQAPGATQPTTSAGHYRHASEDGAAVKAIVSAAQPASGIRYVHRNNSAFHAQPTYASPLLKKEPKGTTVTLLALSDKWAEVQDGSLKGWMRASVLGEAPPGAKKPRKHRGE